MAAVGYVRICQKRILMAQFSALHRRPGRHEHIVADWHQKAARISGDDDRNVW